MKRDKGFTILEVMIAIAIFAFLMLIVSQLMRGEIRLINNVTQKADLEHKARTAIMHVLDEIRLNRYTYYSAGTGLYDSGVYLIEYGNQGGGQGNQTVKCLIDVNPSPSVLAGNYNDLPEGTKIFYNKDSKELWYRDVQSNQVYLIADQIYSFSIVKVTDHLVRLYVGAGDPAKSEPYELLTWVRLY